MNYATFDCAQEQTEHKMKTITTLLLVAAPETPMGWPEAICISVSTICLVAFLISMGRNS